MGIFEKFNPPPQTTLPPTICYNVGGVWHQICLFLWLLLRGLGAFKSCFFFTLYLRSTCITTLSSLYLYWNRRFTPHLFPHLTQGWNSTSAQPPSTGLYPNPQMAKQSHWKSLPEGNYTICLANLLICFRA